MVDWSTGRPTRIDLLFSWRTVRRLVLAINLFDVNYRLRFQPINSSPHLHRLVSRFWGPISIDGDDVVCFLLDGYVCSPTLSLTLFHENTTSTIIDVRVSLTKKDLPGRHHNNKTKRKQRKWNDFDCRPFLFLVFLFRLSSWSNKIESTVSLSRLYSSWWDQPFKSSQRKRKSNHR